MSTVFNAPTRLFAATWLVCMVAASQAYGGALTAGVAMALPVEITEVTAGGTWIDGAASGTFRTVTVHLNTDPETVEVFIQWIGTRSASEPQQVISSLPLQEFNDQKLTWASVSLEGETDGSATIAITGQDAQDRPVGPLVFTAGLPGVYHFSTDGK